LTNYTRFSQRLLEWWSLNQRSFPWRKTLDPYRILLSEILLHRTKAEQVVESYNELLSRYPTIQDLNLALKTDLEAILYSLGLRWRIALLKEMTAEIIERFHGSVPSNVSDLESLPGISHYIASAVRCFAFGYADPLLDTNTVRIFGRVLEVSVTDSSRRSKKLRELVQPFINTSLPRETNYALLDLGALVCKPSHPLCEYCPVNLDCKYGYLRLKPKVKHARHIGTRV
jgi:A/G-specific adenine glycosylase